jgi:transposase
MHNGHKTYTQEFKREAVRLAQTSGKPIAHVARELGISDASIHQWRKELAEHGPEAFPGSGHQTALEEENRRLKRELERTRQERDILKNRQGKTDVGVAASQRASSEVRTAWRLWRKRKRFSWQLVAALLAIRCFLHVTRSS